MNESEEFLEDLFNNLDGGGEQASGKKKRKPKLIKTETASFSDFFNSPLEDPMAESKTSLKDQKKQEWNNKLLDGLSFDQFQKEIQVWYAGSKFKYENYNQYGPLLAVHEPAGFTYISDAKIPTTAVRLKIYPGNSIKNSPDYTDNLEEFIQLHKERIMVRSFTTDKGRVYHRFYLKKFNQAKKRSV